MGLGIKKFLFVSLRIFKYKILSSCKNVTGRPKLYYPLLLTGKGKISFGNNIQNGVVDSPSYFSGYNYLCTKNETASISIGNNTAINNNFSVIARSKIVIGNDVIIGVNCRIEDNDGHNLDLDKRNNDGIYSKPVYIGNNVFLGSGVTVLKGVTIGKNSIIGSSSVVTADIPDNVVAAGNPARVIRTL